jgi:hypothetical protein
MSLKTHYGGSYSGPSYYSFHLVSFYDDDMFPFPSKMFGPAECYIGAVGSVVPVEC